MGLSKVCCRVVVLSNSYSNLPAAYEGLAKQFNVLIAIVRTHHQTLTLLSIQTLSQSTFTASLIVAFLSLANDVITKTKRMEIAMLLGFFAIGTHLLIIIISGRAAALSFRLAADTDVNSPQKADSLQKSDPPQETRVAEFKNYFFVCEQLQLVATCLFLATVLFVAWLLFDPLGYPIAVYGYTVCGIYCMVRTGFWKSSIFWEDVGIIKNAWFAGKVDTPETPKK